MSTRHVIERLGHKGDGVADGPVFVPRALPGEIVEGVLDNGRLSNVRILTPSTDRIAAECPHYRRCGGCDLQHASGAFVDNWKRRVVEQALAARDINVSVRRVHRSPPASRRRAVLTGRRTKTGAIVGFHAPGSAAVHAIPECLLLTPALMKGLPGLERLTTIAASRKSDVRYCVTDTREGVDVLVLGGKPLTLDIRTQTAEIAEAHQFARVVWDDEVVLVREAPKVTIGTCDVPIPPGAFLQATRHGERCLQEAVREAIEGSVGPIVDLFAGVGTFALDLARTHPVYAVEGDRHLLDALDQGWRFGTGVKAVTTEARDLFRDPLRSDRLSTFAAVVIDPPRAGAERQFAELAASEVNVVASVSCDPVTFARDARALYDAGFKIDWLDVVDQFRWSPHIETVARFFR